MKIIEFLAIESLSTAVVVHLNDDARPKWRREVLNVPVVDPLVHSGDHGDGDCDGDGDGDGYGDGGDGGER